MDYQKEWSAGAISDLQAIIEYIDSKNSFATHGVRERILKTVDLLQSSPRLGSLFDIVGGVEIQTIKAGSFRIFHSPNDDKQFIEVKAVQHIKWADPDFAE